MMLWFLECWNSDGWHPQVDYLPPCCTLMGIRIPADLSETQLLGIAYRVSNSAVLGEVWQFAFWSGCQVMTLMLFCFDQHVWTIGTHKRRSEVQRQSVWSLFPSLLEIKQHPSLFWKINLCKCLCVWVWAGAMACGQRSEESLTSDLI